MASVSEPAPWIAPPVKIAWDRAAAAARAALPAPRVQRGPRWLLAAMFVVYLVWGSTYLAIRVALETIPPFSLGAVRFLTAGLALYAALRLAGAPRPTTEHWRNSLLTGVLLFVFGNGFVVLGQQWVDSGLVALIVGTMPLWAAVFGGAFGHSPSRREWFGLVLGFLGVAVLQLGGGLGAAGAGAFVVLLAPVCWALGVVLARARSLPAGPMGAATQMIAGGAVLLAVSRVAGESFAAVPSVRSMLALAYLVVFGSLIGFTAYAYLLRHARPAVANSYAYVNPIVAIVLGAAFAGEVVGPSTWLAAAVILAGLAVLRGGRAR